MPAALPAAERLKAVPPPTGGGLHRSVAWLAHYEPPLGAHGTASTARPYFAPREGLTAERPTTNGWARCKMCSPAVSHRGARPAMPTGHAAPGLKAGAFWPPKGKGGGVAELFEALDSLRIQAIEVIGTQVRIGFVVAQHSAAARTRTLCPSVERLSRRAWSWQRTPWGDLRGLRERFLLAARAGQVQSPLAQKLPAEAGGT
jgi:hypothetical protein